MSNASAKTFDAVQAIRAVRDDINAKIATMSAGEEDRWIRSTEFSDPRPNGSWTWLSNKALQPPALRAAAERSRWPKHPDQRSRGHDADPGVCRR